MGRGPTLLLEAAKERGKYVSHATVAAVRADLGELLDHQVLDVAHTIPSDHPDLLAQYVAPFLQTVGAAR